MDAGNVSGLSPFVPGDTSTVSARWKKWKRSFNIFLDVHNVTIAARQKSYLLHYVGPQVQDVFFSLQGNDAPAVPEGSDVFKEAVKLLDEYFLPMKCLPLERHKFRNLEQNEDEPIEGFVLRLREQGNLCEYGDHLEEEIKEQLFEKGVSDDLRATILNKPQMTLAETIEAGRSLETIGKHRKTTMFSPQLEEVYKVSRSKNNIKGKCYRCGRSGHFANDESCPALNRKCERCGHVGHFKKRCNTKQRKKEGKWRRQVMSDSYDSDDSKQQSGSDSEEENVQYLFAMEPVEEAKAVCTVGGVSVKWVVDSGAGVNVIDRQTWERLKEKEVSVSHQSTGVRATLKTYAGQNVTVAGMFCSQLATKKKTVRAEIYVVEDGTCCLLGRKTAVALGILNISAEGQRRNGTRTRTGTAKF
ncbi:uncharacterized protein LOC119769064 [Culex quinquefasciatus]|uniref:uncharacterized protein LOC119769064 n=1 Tax=Culex quinquefasciatus TaxID=7176 RepID=UPI0018E30521|nr:uncharacterized protein LOC119769064 [Culex quinquefasciatus]